MTFEVGFLGYGSMAKAISEGLAASGLFPFEKQIISGRDRDKLAQAAGERGLTVAADNRDLTRRTKTIIIGVKPHQVMAVLAEIGDLLTADRLLISLAAGVGLAAMRNAIPENAALVRSMPNVAALVGRGTTLLCSSVDLDEAKLETAKKIFESVGVCLQMDEHFFDVACAVSGCGPAYFFEIMENMIRGAVRLGLSWADARKLVVNTALGSAEMASRLGDSPLASLRDMVTSPGGTTAEALYVFEKGALGSMIQEALEAATKKSQKLT